jgi:hypothetical protein
VRDGDASQQLPKLLIIPDSKEQVSPCLGMMRDFLLSLAAFPASSSTSAARYSRTAAR